MKFGRQFALRQNLWPSHFPAFDYAKYSAFIKIERENLLHIACEGGGDDTKKCDRALSNIPLFDELREQMKQLDGFYVVEEKKVLDGYIQLKKEVEDSDHDDDDESSDQMWEKIMQHSTTAEDLKSFALFNVSALCKLGKKVKKHLGLRGIKALWEGEVYETQMHTSSKIMEAHHSFDRLVFSPKEVADTARVEVAESLDGYPHYRRLKCNADYFCFDPIVEDFSTGIHKVWIDITADGLGQKVSLPAIVARGIRDGPTVGITAAVHGNELNGIPLIHNFMRKLDPNRVVGTIVAVPIVNVPGFQRNSRYFLDGEDLNRVMPGKENGNCSKQFAYRVFHRIIRCFDYLIDLHTASFGRSNSLYVRADMNHDVTARMSELQNPQIIVHNTGPDGSMRGACASFNIHAITVEIGDPSKFQIRYIQDALVGVTNILKYLQMIPGSPKLPTNPAVLCNRSFWIFSKVGGILRVLPELAQWISKGEKIAVVKDCFGTTIKEYFAPCNGIVIGKNCNPNNFVGDRILHLGVVSGQFASNQQDGH